MKISNSNKTKQTITITGDSAEMVLLLELAEKMAQQKYDSATGLEKETYSDCVDTYSEIGNSISNGDYFA